MAGIATGFLGSILYLGVTENRFNSYEDFLLVFLASGAFGGIIGSLIPKYFTISFTENDNFSILNGVKSMPELSQLNYTLINYSFNF